MSVLIHNNKTVVCPLLLHKGVCVTFCYTLFVNTCLRVEYHFLFNMHILGPHVKEQIPACDSYTADFICSPFAISGQRFHAPKSVYQYFRTLGTPTRRWGGPVLGKWCSQSGSLIFKYAIPHSPKQVFLSKG